jgi:hypothetical protein
VIRRFRASDCPDADGRQPQPGEHKWTLSFPLEGGDDYLEVEIGAKGRAAIRAMLAQEEDDDAKEGKTV